MSHIKKQRDKRHRRIDDYNNVCVSNDVDDAVQKWQYSGFGLVWLARMTYPLD